MAELWGVVRGIRQDRVRWCVMEILWGGSDENLGFGIFPGRHRLWNKLHASESPADEQTPLHGACLRLRTPGAI